MDEAQVAHAPVRVLMVHNAYQQRGGEDAVVEAEVALLRSRGHEVTEYRRDNSDIGQMTPGAVARSTLWSKRTETEICEILRGGRIDVVHCHNTFPLVSPAIYWAAERCRVPVVQTLHNFRLLCPQGILLRDGQVCEACVGRVPWRAVAHGCYRQSRAQSAVLVGMLSLHRALGSYRNKVAVYIALNSFCRDKLIEGGLPGDRIQIKPNFVDRPKPPESIAREGFLFVGRLSSEKGVHVLATAMSQSHGFSLRVAGVGPEVGALDRLPQVKMLGRLNAAQVSEEMFEARALILPSICYESFPLALVEAYASGLPVIGSRIGALAELIEHGRTGLLVEPQSPTALIEAMNWANSNPGAMEDMGMRARSYYESHLDPASNYAQLMQIYKKAVNHSVTNHH